MDNDELLEMLAEQYIGFEIDDDRDLLLDFIDECKKKYKKDYDINSFETLSDLFGEDYLALCLLQYAGAREICQYIEPTSRDDSNVEKNEHQQIMEDNYGEEGNDYYEVHLGTIKYCFELMAPFNEVLDEWVEELK